MRISTRTGYMAAGIISLLLLLAVLFWPGGRHQEQLSGPINAGTGVVSARILYAMPEMTESAVLLPAESSPAATLKPARFPAIYQRDKSQYRDEAEWNTWSASACSAAALASVINGYGQALRVTDVLAYLQQQNAIKSNAGLYKYSVFGDFAGKYGLKTVYSEDKNLDNHFGRVMNFLKQGYPVILNVLDPVYFPAGHFIVGTGLNPDGTVAVLNPDPVKGSPVNQNWPLEGLKLYFSRLKRSAAILPA